MKKLAIISIGILFFILQSCNSEAEKPKVIYNATRVLKTTQIDSSQIQIADLPIQMPGSNYLIHPIGDLRLFERGTKTKYGSSSVNEGSFTISNYSQYEITGFLQNLKFQKIGSDSLKTLSDKPIVIQTATYLKSVADKLNKKIMVYTMMDQDTNNDGKLDANDIKTLYLSDHGGGKFTKISPELQELVDWNLIESTSTLYFRTVEDTNKNGKFDKNDVVHYNYINFEGADWKVIVYQPI